ncbi:MAG TPA: peptide chain release factor N(5)-glutamine methyltransferase [Anaerolineales bacterium]|nr:peptide chain release factor N(5)-glutamine methyltransferase [Anaerolineales bacterium]HND91160.1 peptide chain release factor N(5)-glutamine methyltransferase [Anaerolineales bacterium]HUM25816.1 peptide chain release factor N(5)-glutamine methyltransferase [Anaerolineales bacterium]
MNAGEYLNNHKAALDGLDAQILLAHVIKRPRTWLLAHLETPLTPPQLVEAEQAFARLIAGEPLPYIIGHWEFFGLDFDITHDVLIPRPETELLVEKALAWLNRHPEARSVADIGTGSGAIAVSIAANIPDAHILATDLSPAALNVAKGNAEKFHVQNQIQFLECDLLPASSPNLHSSSFNLLCANLPYIPTSTLRQLPIFGREPTLALDGGPDGLDVYRRLFKAAPAWLKPGGMMLFEIESTLGVQAAGLAFDSFSNAVIHLHQDLAGKDRLLEIIPSPDAN